MLCLRCEEREKGWNITSTLTFYEKGMINERVFHNDNISKFDQQSKLVLINIHFYLLAAKKYYQRRGVVLDIDEVPVMTTEKFEEVDIFSSEEDDDDWEWEKS